MKKLLNYSLLTLALALGTSTVAMAHEDRHDRDRDRDNKNNGCDNQAPEIDAGMAVSGMTLLGGTLTVLRSRRRK